MIPTSQRMYTLTAPHKELRMKLLLRVLLIAFLLAFLFVVPVFAQGETPQSPLEVILSVFVQFGGLAGFGAALAAVVNVLKHFKVVTDGTAGRWFAALSLASIALLVYLKLFQPQIAIEYLDAQAAIFAQILLLILGYVVQLGSGLFAHGLFANLRLPVIGKSFAKERKAIG